MRASALLGDELVAGVPESVSGARFNGANRGAAAEDRRATPCASARAAGEVSPYGPR
ncbi:hypothetical protein [Streptomyces guryensis]|uniref:Uncharacterized protein n=1 Tax=Streptomyces guryensis TaxID=2886947 RepID=A0A9Q3VLF5_9ACTN|nr:hypothetical protein [Streptomyces guryensis]MCD9873694.1 hypothetical protein [Streptomyces guryensis]